MIGGGPAGLSAALVLGRARRRVVVFDSNEYRNAGSRAVHGWLTRDGADPAELRRLGRAELERYGIDVLPVRITSIRAVDGRFELFETSGGRVRARTVILATGLRDVLPPIPGVQELVGRGVYVCPYCDAWEVRDQPIGVVGDHGAGLALSLCSWSRDVVLFTNGRALDAADLPDLDLCGVSVVDAPVRRLVAHEGRLEAVELSDGRQVPRVALFVKLVRQEQRSDLARQLGLAEVGRSIVVDRHGATFVPGVWVAGDASRDLLFASVAVAEGAAAAVAVNHALQLDALTAKRRRRR